MNYDLDCYVWSINQWDWFDISGVHHGQVLSSIVGGSKARWGVWGTTLDIAKEIHTAAKPNTITVSM